MNFIRTTAESESASKPRKCQSNSQVGCEANQCTGLAEFVFYCQVHYVKMDQFDVWLHIILHLLKPN